ncbi:DUF3769 domain-containing protein [Prochlorococcus marinus]|uniref:DUF3769 domain-containing protein n=1 Tax=Prochlorococcus marinus TaxID=1219 RepID=UPI001ADA98D1|nr:DUF3769 domain-containing protein [Prochlorococcus marinus]MBO8217653.1 DUF3769 domain-containing protein [Prochlorococcus marinus XMU1405]MBW3040815.1 hypothetical protein [Prochlorococcus marinus str. MU1405]MBW3048274.1 hypothetical protein [Prochlorococcus marinus str. MU1406]
MKKKYLSFIPFLVLNFLGEKINTETLHIKKTNISFPEKSSISKNLLINNEIDIQYNLQNFVYLLAEKINSQNINDNSTFDGLNIISNSQLKTKNKFIAQGNVQIKKNNMHLQSDKLIYDLEKRIITVSGKIKFISGEQFFNASKIEYNLTLKEGVIKDLYGTINFEKLDLKNFKNTSSDQNLFNDIESSITNVKLNKSSTFEFNDITSPQNVKVEINNMTKWRMQSEEIKIKDGIWSAEILYLTNDPFNKPQIILKNKNFKSFEKDGKFFIESEWSSIILEDKLNIPIGPRKYNLNKGNNFRWGIGYDKGNKDGIHLIRYADPLTIGRKTSININKEFYIQRLLQGNSKSFSKENESVLAEKSEQSTKFSDYFGLSSELNSEFFGLDFNSEIKFNSLDFDKFKKIITFKGELSKKLYSYQDKDKEKETTISIFGTYRDKVWNGSIGEKDILTAYGFKLEDSKKWKTNQVSNLENIAAGYGEYQSNKKSTENNIISRKRLNLLWHREHNFHLWKVKDDSELNKGFKFTPEPINKGIDLLVSSKIDLYSYDDGNFQNLITFKAGPNLTLGNLKNNFFDYTRINIFGKTTIANGESPFDFDQSVDNHAIELGIEQQLIGPLVMKYSTEYNLDIDSPKFHEFSNNKYELSWNRRAYNIGVFYNTDKQTGGVNFEINSFSFDGFNEKFIN